jgi:two-component system sensor histidine kinase KdpD
MQNFYDFFMCRRLPMSGRVTESGTGRSMARTAIRNYAYAAAVVSLAVGAAVVFRRLPHANLSLLFLTAVLIVAARWGLWPSIFSSVLSFLALNFFFTAPFFTFKVEEEGDVATLVFFLGMAALTGNLAARMREETAKSRESLDRISQLLDFSRRMAAVASANDALQALVDRLSNILQCRAFAYLPDANSAVQLQAGAVAPDPIVRRLRIWCHPLWAGTIITLLGIFWAGRKMNGMI